MITLNMQTQGQLEAAVCEALTRFQHEHMGRGPKAASAHLIKDLLVVRLLGVLTIAEQNLAQSQGAGKGRDLLKQVRAELLESARPQLTSLVERITGVKVVSLHHDISTRTGERLVVFTLSEPPLLRDTSAK